MRDHSPCTIVITLTSGFLLHGTEARPVSAVSRGDATPGRLRGFSLFRAEAVKFGTQPLLLTESFLGAPVQR